MKKNNKQLIFERMGLSSPKLTMQQPVKEEVPSAGNFISELQSIFHKHGYFIAPDDPYVGLTVKNIDENQEEYNQQLENIQDAWSKISLPY